MYLKNLTSELMYNKQRNDVETKLRNKLGNQIKEKQEWELYFDFDT